MAYQSLVGQHHIVLPAYGSGILCPHGINKRFIIIPGKRSVCGPGLPDAKIRARARDHAQPGRFSVFQFLRALYGRRYPASALNETLRRPAVYGHYGRAAEQTAEIDPVADFLSVRGDQSNSSRFVVDNTDSRFIRDDRGDCLPGSISGHGDHIQAYRTNAGHCLSLSSDRARLGSRNHSFVLADRYKARTVRHAAGSHHSPFSPRRSEEPARPSYRGFRRLTIPFPQGSPQHCRRPQVGAAGIHDAKRHAGRSGFLATSCPILVILKAVFLIVSARTSNGARYSPDRRLHDTGSAHPTFMADSPPTPWNAPAMNGLSSTALAGTTSFAQPRLPGKQSGVPS